MHLPCPLGPAVPAIPCAVSGALQMCLKARSLPGAASGVDQPGCAPGMANHSVEQPCPALLPLEYVSS